MSPFTIRHACLAQSTDVGSGSSTGPLDAYRPSLQASPANPSQGEGPPCWSLLRYPANVKEIAFSAPLEHDLIEPESDEEVAVRDDQPQTRQYRLAAMLCSPLQSRLVSNAQASTPLSMQLYATLPVCHTAFYGPNVHVQHHRKRHLVHSQIPPPPPPPHPNPPPPYPSPHYTHKTRAAK